MLKVQADYFATNGALVFPKIVAVRVLKRNTRRNTAMTKQDYDRIVFSFITVFLAVHLLIVSLKLGAAYRTVGDLREQIISMEVRE